MWLISDTHFNHANILQFVSTWKDGQRVRPEFGEDAIQEMNEKIIDNWNRTVMPGDKIYHLGDIGSDKEWLTKTFARLHGKKRLILGNHDNYDMTFYAQFFEKIMVSRKVEDVILTHYPIRMDFELRRKANIHGHIHEVNLPDDRYLNVSVEQTDYTPIHIDAAFEILRRRGVLE